MNIFFTIAISAIATIGSFFGVYNYVPLRYLQPEKPLVVGSTITTINGSDTLSSSRSVINTNFANLNADKIEATQTTLNSLTSATSLASIGTITSGVWNGSTVTVPYGGTGSTTLSSNQILLGNGTSALKVVSGLGTSGQFLTSGGAGVAPTWTTGGTDTAGTYNWTGLHTFNATTTMATSTVASSTITNLNITSATTTNLSIANTASTTNLIVSGTCTGCATNGYEQVTATQALDTANNAQTTQTVSCTAGKKITGGGFNTPGTAYIVSNSNPSNSTTWTATVQCESTALGTCSAGNLTVYAICVNN